MESLRKEVFVTAEAIKDTNAHYYPSASGIDISVARMIAFFLTLAKTSTPTSIKFTVQISADGGTTWHDYEDSPFDAWIVSAAAITGDTFDKIENMVDGSFLGKQLRVKAVGTGTDGSNYFTATLNALILEKQV